MEEIKFNGIESKGWSVCTKWKSHDIRVELFREEDFCGHRPLYYSFELYVMISPWCLFYFRHMEHNNIFLVGPMGTGKSTIGKRLAKSLSKDFLDSDHIQLIHP